MHTPSVNLKHQLLPTVAGLALLSGCTGGAAPPTDEDTGPPATPGDVERPRVTRTDPAPDATPTAAQTGGPAQTDASSPDAPAGDFETGPLPMGRLLFDSERDDNLDIWMLESGEPEPIRITTDPAFDRVPNWGPDGESVIFASSREGGPDSPTGLRSYGVWIAYLDGSEAEHLLGSRSFNHAAAYSPDGSEVAFHSDAGGTFQVYVIDADGSGSPTPLTDDPVQANFGSWSPDGEQIAFTSLRDSQGTDYNREVYIMDADGSNQTRLTDDPASDSSPAFSPDGAQIAFHSDRDGTASIYVMDADGSGVTRLTDDGGEDRYASWSPDGSMIAFESDRAGQTDIFVMNADGTGLVNVTNSDSRDGFPAWGD